jgi:uncharacterized membrane protein
LEPISLFLERIDVFSAWYLYLIVIGISKMFSIYLRDSLLIGFVVWLCSMITSTSMRTFFRIWTVHSSVI